MGEWKVKTRGVCVHLGGELLETVGWVSGRVVSGHSGERSGGQRWNGEMGYGKGTYVIIRGGVILDVGCGPPKGFARLVSILDDGEKCKRVNLRCGEKVHGLRSREADQKIEGESKKRKQK